MSEDSEIRYYYDRKWNKPTDKPSSAFYTLLRAMEPELSHSSNGWIENLYTNSGDHIPPHCNPVGAPSLSTTDPVVVYSGGSSAVHALTDRRTGRVVHRLVLPENSLTVLSDPESR